MISRRKESKNNSGFQQPDTWEVPFAAKQKTIPTESWSVLPREKQMAPARQKPRNPPEQGSTLER